MNALRLMNVLALLLILLPWRAQASMALATAPPIPAIAPLSGLRMANTKASTALAAYHITA